MTTVAPDPRAGHTIPCADRARPLVAVLLGTDHHPFDRLVRWASELASVGGCRAVVQHGATALPDLLPSGIHGSDMIAPDDLAALLLEADAVVTHGGPGLIMEARQAGHVPVVVPRDPGRGEHVDDHQLRFSQVVADAGLVTRVEDQPGFEQAVRAAAAAGQRDLSGADHAPAVARFSTLVDQLMGVRVPQQRTPRS